MPETEPPQDLLPSATGPWLGLDIGGANLKLASSLGWSCSQPYPLWKDPGGLADELAPLLARCEPFCGLALTMTGELADCFRTKDQGVASILQSVWSIARNKPLWVWGLDREFHTLHAALQQPRLFAASNWLALATWIATESPASPSLLIDIGSTTSDLIPLEQGRCIATGRTDLGRLQAGELLYTGLSRTPLCALASSVQLRGQSVPLAAELFATTRDLYLVLGWTESDPQDTNTANGRPATREEARDRLARMLCCDRFELSDDELLDIALQLAEVQLQQLVQAAQRNLHRLPDCETVVLSGSGTLLGQRLFSRVCEQRPASLPPLKLITLADEWSPPLSDCACAYAVSKLADRQFRATE